MKDLFGVESGDKPLHPKTNQAAISLHRKLLQLHGEKDGEKCKNCRFFLIKKFSKTYFKCEKSGKTGSSASSDWRANWQACGKFESDEV